MQPPRTQLSRTGLARYRSAPATWLEALLESDEEQPQPQPQPAEEVVLELPKPPPIIKTDFSDVDLDFLESSCGAGLTNFLRQNSSPAEFLSLLNNTSSDGYFSNLGIPPNYASSHSSKRASEAEDVDKNISPNLLSSSSSSTPLKRENSGPLQRATGGSLDLEMEKLLEESVVTRARAKRGCATHPRSIAERVRRTRISDRIRKLQELVPNMDKQTNTADMLEEAVAYVKLLQKQIQEFYCRTICPFMLGKRNFTVEPSASRRSCRSTKGTANAQQTIKGWICISGNNSMKIPQLLFVAVK